SPTDIWSVGAYHPSTSTTYQTLKLHWNGVAWSVVSGPGPDYGLLTGVSARATDDVWAVGSGPGSGIDPTLTMHWDGASWRVVSSPNPGTYTNYMKAVA